MDIFCGVVAFVCCWCYVCWLLLVVVRQFLDVPAARLIFEVTIEGSARKIITVRSALMIHNQLEDEVEVRLVNQTRGSAGQLRISHFH